MKKSLPNLNTPPIPSLEEQREQGWYCVYQADQFTYCCGGIEIGALDCYQKNVWQKGWGDVWHKRTGLHKTPQEGWKQVIKNIRDGYEHFPLMFNIRPNNESELREVLKKEPDAALIHTWRNVNTDNVLEMWILTNGSDTEHHERDDSDD